MARERRGSEWLSYRMVWTHERMGSGFPPGSRIVASPTCENRGARDFSLVWCWGLGHRLEFAERKKVFDNNAPMLQCSGAQLCSTAKELEHQLKFLFKPSWRKLHAFT